MNNIPKESIRLLRDVDAYMVPSGDEVKLLAGNLVRITQALGGNYTVIMNGNMVQITSENADALGIELDEKESTEIKGDLEQQIWDQLKTCYDPETLSTSLSPLIFLSTSSAITGPIPHPGAVNVIFIATSFPP